MRVSMFARTDPPDGLEYNCDNIFFATHINLAKLYPLPITFRVILLQFFYELRYNPPKELRGGVWNFTIQKIVYWAKVGNQSMFKTVEIPLKDPNAIYPPLSKSSRFYRIHFVFEIKRIKDCNLKVDYPKSRFARHHKDNK